jgi:hypothetical protein
MPDHKKNSMKISIKLLFGLILSTLICYTSLAHPGGHYLQQDEANLHHWKLNINNQQVIGNLSMTKNNMVYVEGVNGKIWNIPMELIDSDDMKYVNTEMEKINQWNGVINFATTGIVNTWKLKDILSLISIGLLALLFYTLSVYSKKRNFSPNWSVTFTMLTIICVIGFFISCKKRIPPEMVITMVVVEVITVSLKLLLHLLIRHSRLLSLLYLLTGTLLIFMFPQQVSPIII